MDWAFTFTEDDGRPDERGLNRRRLRSDIEKVIVDFANVLVVLNERAQFGDVGNIVIYGRGWGTGLE